MQSIHPQDLCAISGGTNCIDVETWKSLNQKAIRDGVILSSIVTTVASGFVWGFTESVAPTAMFFAAAAPYVAIYGYSKSGSLSAFERGDV